MLKTIASALAFGLLAMPGLAKDMTYLCRLDVAKTQQWVPAQVAILHVSGDKTAVVNDPIIVHLLKRPVTAKVVADNAERITFTWELPRGRNSAGQETPQFLYRASYFKKTGKVHISATPAGFRNTFGAYGICAVK